ALDILELFPGLAEVLTPDVLMGEAGAEFFKDPLGFLATNGFSLALFATASLLQRLPTSLAAPILGGMSDVNAAEALETMTGTDAGAGTAANLLIALGNPIRAAGILSLMSPRAAARILAAMPDDDAVAMANNLDAVELVPIMAHMTADKAARMLQGKDATEIGDLYLASDQYNDEHVARVISTMILGGRDGTTTPPGPVVTLDDPNVGLQTEEGDIDIAFQTLDGTFLAGRGTVVNGRRVLVADFAASLDGALSAGRRWVISVEVDGQPQYRILDSAGEIVDDVIAIPPDAEGGQWTAITIRENPTSHSYRYARGVGRILGRAALRALPAGTNIPSQLALFNSVVRPYPLPTTPRLDNNVNAPAFRLFSNGGTTSAGTRPTVADLEQDIATLEGTDNLTREQVEETLSKYENLPKTAYKDVSPELRLKLFDLLEQVGMPFLTMSRFEYQRLPVSERGRVPTGILQILSEQLDVDDLPGASDTVTDLYESARAALEANPDLQNRLANWQNSTSEEREQILKDLAEVLRVAMGITTPVEIRFGAIGTNGKTYNRTPNQPHLIYLDSTSFTHFTTGAAVGADTVAHEMVHVWQNQQIDLYLDPNTRDQVPADQRYVVLGMLSYDRYRAKRGNLPNDVYDESWAEKPAFTVGTLIGQAVSDDIRRISNFDSPQDIELVGPFIFREGNPIPHGADPNRHVDPSYIGQPVRYRTDLPMGSEWDPVTQSMVPIPNPRPSHPDDAKSTAENDERFDPNSDYFVHEAPWSS
nr:hypothetical protein [Rhodobacter sp.]